MKIYTTIVKLLVNSGADINITNPLGGTALDVAKRYKHQKIVEYLQKIH